MKIHQVNPEREKISVVMATYNGELFLKQQLDSFLQQEMQPDELIISDDGSTDSTMLIIEEFISMLPPFEVKVVRNGYDSGCTSNFTNGIQQSTGEIILLSDQDDIWLPQHISMLVKSMLNDPELLCVASDSLCVDINLCSLGYTTRQSERFSPSYLKAHNQKFGTQLEVAIKQFAVSGHGMAFRRALLPYLFPISNHWIHDQWIFLLASIIGKTVYIPDVLTYYRQYGNQAVGGAKKSLTTWSNMCANTSEERELVDAYKWEDIFTRYQTLQSPYIKNIKLNQLLLDKIEFMKKRISIRRTPPLLRLIAVTLSILKGDYYRLSRGLLACGRDLLGKA